MILNSKDCLIISQKEYLMFTKGRKTMIQFMSCPPFFLNLFGTGIKTKLKMIRKWSQNLIWNWSQNQVRTLQLRFSSELEPCYRFRVGIIYGSENHNLENGSKSGYNRAMARSDPFATQALCNLGHMQRTLSIDIPSSCSLSNVWTPPWWLHCIEVQTCEG